MKPSRGMAEKSGLRAESCVWTDEEVGLLLQITLNYKQLKLREKRDWETCASKYVDIWLSFLAELREKEACEDFPRVNDEITRLQLAAKLKSIRGKYRQAVESGKRSGHGRVVLLFYDVCDRIWGGALGDVLSPCVPRAPALDTGLESADIKEERGEIKEEPGENASSSTSRSPSPGSERAPASPSSFIKMRPRPIHPQVNGFVRSSQVKKRAASDLAEEDLEIKRGMLELLRSQCQRADERMDRLMSSMDALINVITQTHTQLLTQCPCRGRPPQAAESHSAPATPPLLLNAFTVAVKKEPEDPAGQ